MFLEKQYLWQNEWKKTPLCLVAVSRKGLRRPDMKSFNLFYNIKTTDIYENASLTGPDYTTLEYFD